LHFISVGPAAAEAPASRRVSGEGLRGAVGSVDGRTVAVLFAGPAGAGQVALGVAAELVVIVGLLPGKRYGVSFAEPACTLTLGPSANAADPPVPAGGFLRASGAACKKP
jgi:hypothetical protein